ncbi:hypothetical protein OBBRIDRAFT_864815 [Obba rivulosa]|uniref:Uncharacterized protein n=1 Tax=Obba rivulosa TaxID=1052685 RepID=A0A8E2B2D0_9APHY|nr:hypothetical protein OBBRIDRAFT_864815 [Obba rivulosa]
MTVGTGAVIHIRERRIAYPTAMQHSYVPENWYIKSRIWNPNALTAEQNDEHREAHRNSDAPLRVGSLSLAFQIPTSLYRYPSRLVDAPRQVADAGVNVCHIDQSSTALPLCTCNFAERILAVSFDYHDQHSYLYVCCNCQFRRNTTLAYMGPPKGGLDTAFKFSALIRAKLGDIHPPPASFLNLNLGTSQPCLTYVYYSANRLNRRLYWCSGMQ